MSNKSSRSEIANNIDTDSYDVIYYYKNINWLDGKKDVINGTKID